MPANDPKKAARLAALRHKLKIVADSKGDNNLEALAGGGIRSDEAGMESLGQESAGFLRDAAYEAETTVLKKVENADYADVSDEEYVQTEAIVEREFRQVSFIVRGSFQDLPAPWTHLNSGAIRATIEGVIPSIGRVERLSPSGRRSDHIGSGFIVGHRLLMTNRHVAEVFFTGAGLQSLVYKPGASPAANFGRERDTSPIDQSGTLRVTSVKMVHPFWDMALLELAEPSKEITPLVLSLELPENMVGRHIVTIGYPGRGNDRRPEAVELEEKHFGSIFGVKRIAPGMIDGREETISFKHRVPAMIHDCSTLAGNSGSAVIDVETGKVLGLHFKGLTLEANFSVPVAELARDKRVVDAGVKFDTGHVVPSSPWEAWWKNPSYSGPSAESTATPSLPPKNSQPDKMKDAQISSSVHSGTAAASSGNSFTWTIPLQISVSIGNALPVAAAAAQETIVETAEEVAGELESFQIPIIHDGLEERGGYDPEFLDLPGGEQVPLPGLTEKGRKVVARQEDGEAELKYHHFSVVMHKKRRLALFTAANLDWRKESHQVNGRRFSRNELSGIPEGVAEQWVTDDRIPENEQLPDMFFNLDRKAFDKGHLVRREDVAWGRSFEDIQMANGDTYHTTNCSPQVKEFNQGKYGNFNWGVLESMIQKETKFEKTILFSGPVLKAGDTIFAGVSESGIIKVPIPKQYWKILVAQTEEGPKAFGFILDQDLSNVLFEEVAREEEFAMPSAWRKYQKTIKEIEENLLGLVKLDWCRKHDDLA